jgi:hypothetical protein
LPPQKGGFFVTIPSVEKKFMPVNFEIKGNLARLLATENLIVEHKKVETAQFDIDNRVLTLPVWEKASATVYDMLVGHEVGHALYTPLTEWKKTEEYKNVPYDYVNVVEDARIEKLMKRKFAGLSRDFYNAYQELNREDFFCTKDSDLNEFLLIDKINLYFKIGAYLVIDFSEIEEEFIVQIRNCETFEEVLEISKNIYEYTKSQRIEKKSFSPNESSGEDQQQENQQSLSETSDHNQTKSEDSFPDEEENNSEQNENSNSTSVENSIDESKTQRAFSSNTQQLIDNYSVSDTLYLTLPEIDLNQILVTFDKIFDHLKRFYHINDNDIIRNEVIQFNQFKKSSVKEVNYLVKEFEMKKSADSYSRSLVSKTGVLDTSKLHTYKHNEDLFRKVTVIPEGKNHGLIFILDWSGSMQCTIQDSIKQLFSLLWFCQKVNIPFEVYAFSNDAWALNQKPGEYYSNWDNYPTTKEWKERQVSIEGSFRMVNIFSSKSKKREFDEMMKLMWILSKSFVSSQIPNTSAFGLSSTPFNESIIALRPILRKFISENKLQKCHTIFFTDGEGNPATYNTYLNYGKDEYKFKEKSRRIVRSNFFIRNSITGKTYNAGNNDSENSAAILLAIKDEFSQSNFIGFRLIDRKEYRSFYDWYAHIEFDSYDRMRESIKKQGSVCLKSSAFDILFGIPCSNLFTDTEFSVSEDASKREVSNAFRKMFRGKMTNKKVLSTFISQIV